MYNLPSATLMLCQALCAPLARGCLTAAFISAALLNPDVHLLSLQLLLSSPVSCPCPWRAGTSPSRDAKGHLESSHKPEAGGAEQTLTRAAAFPLATSLQEIKGEFWISRKEFGWTT